VTHTAPVPQWGSNNTRRYRTQFIRHGNLAPEICAPLLQAM